MLLIPLTEEGRQLLEQLDRPPMATLRVKRLALTTPVRLRSGVEGVVTGYSSEDVNRYRVSAYDPRRQKVYHTWVDRADFDVNGVANCAAAGAVAQLA